MNCCFRSKAKFHSQMNRLPFITTFILLCLVHCAYQQQLGVVGSLPNMIIENNGTLAGPISMGIFDNNNQLVNNSGVIITFSVYPAVHAIYGSQSATTDGTGKATFNDFRIDGLPFTRITLTFQNGGLEYPVDLVIKSCATHVLNTAFENTTRSCACDKGYYRYQVGCLPCDLGSFSDSVSNIDQCQKCPLSTTTLHTAAIRSQDCVCQEGTLEMNGKCVKCPVGAVCSTNRVRALPGFYLMDLPSGTTVKQCPINPENCQGGLVAGDAQCKVGHIGVFCGACAPGWGFDGSECELCPESPDFEWAVVMFMYGLLSAWMIKLQKTNLDAFDLLKVFVDAIQCLALIGSFNMKSSIAGYYNSGPKFANGVHDLLNLVTLQGRILAYDCSTPNWIYDGLYAFPLYPIFFAAITFFGSMIWNFGQKIVKQRVGVILGSREDPRSGTFRALDQALSVFTMDAYLLFPAILSRVAQILRCVDDPTKGAGARVLELDTSVVCASPEHIGNLIFAFFVFAFYGLGLPAIVAKIAAAWRLRVVKSMNQFRASRSLLANQDADDQVDHDDEEEEDEDEEYSTPIGDENTFGVATDNEEDQENVEESNDDADFVDAQDIQVQEENEENEENEQGEDGQGVGNDQDQIVEVIDNDQDEQDDVNLPKPTVQQQQLRLIEYGLLSQIHALMYQTTIHLYSQYRVLKYPAFEIVVWSRKLAFLMIAYGMPEAFASQFTIGFLVVIASIALTYLLKPHESQTVWQTEMVSLITTGMFLILMASYHMLYTDSAAFGIETVNDMLMFLLLLFFVLNNLALFMFHAFDKVKKFEFYTSPWFTKLYPDVAEIAESVQDQHVN
eukprot:TRINITY_DN1569_c0_g1_i3.p1 TRINITY_DN1569_c0_g1~~TRINITY_DN1569_c0_g1_i3.p1  ORF type:complete len:843 (-),score=231.32 TRINITY_DN1569_c0_g1_i3:330-2858(-)